VGFVDRRADANRGDHDDERDVNVERCCRESADRKDQSEAGEESRDGRHAHQPAAPGSVSRRRLKRLLPQFQRALEVPDETRTGAENDGGR